MFTPLDLLITRCHATDITTSDLSDLVNNLAAETGNPDAEAINRDGMTAQLTYLDTVLGYDELRRKLWTMAQDKRLVA